MDAKKFSLRHFFWKQTRIKTILYYSGQFEELTKKQSGGAFRSEFSKLRKLTSESTAEAAPRLTKRLRLKKALAKTYPFRVKMFLGFAILFLFGENLIH
jgi:hypothetical protein